MTAGLFHTLRRATPGQRLALALLVSLLIHALIYGGWQLGRHLGWKELPLPSWMKALSVAKLLTPKPPDPEKLKLLLPPPIPPEREVQLTFVDVDPTQAISEPPKAAKYYSTANTKAANPTPPKVESNIPQVDGKQTRIVKTVEAAKPVPQPPAPKAPPEPKPDPKPEPKAEPKAEPPPTPPTPAPPPPQPTPPAPQPKAAPPQPQPAPQPAPQPLQPAPAPPPPPRVEIVKAEPTPKPPEPKGDLAMLRPAPELKPAPAKADTGKSSAAELQPTPPPRPRTLKEARAQLDNSAIAGERMKQDGGVRNLGHVGLDVRSTLTGAYDAALIQAVQSRWYFLLEGRASTPRGKAVVLFRLHHDGRVTDVKVAECDVGDLLGLICQKAIVDPARYAPWPSDMRRQLNTDYRDVKFTFYYN